MLHFSDLSLYLEQHPLSLYPGEFSSLLDELHWIYTESNPVENAHIRALFRNIDTILQKIPPKESDEIFSLTSQLCFEYESQAFSHGILAGLHLAKQLYDLL